MNGGPQIPTRESPGPPKTFLGRWLCARSEIEARGLQVLNGVTGFLVHSPEGAAHRALELLGDAELRGRLGENGQLHVKQNFLLTRHLKDYLLLMMALEHPAEDIVQMF